MNAGRPFVGGIHYIQSLTQLHFINADVVNAMMFPFCTTRFVLGPFVPVVLFLGLLFVKMRP